MDFKTFFSTSTPHTREHQQVAIRSFNRKHLNQVPYSKNNHKIHPRISAILKNKVSIKEKISQNLARDILKSYNQDINKEENNDFIREINRTGITIERKGSNYYLIYNPDK